MLRYHTVHYILDLDAIAFRWPAFPAANLSRDSGLRQTCNFTVSEQLKARKRNTEARDLEAANDETRELQIALL
jgi:hypothetical protein